MTPVPSEAGRSMTLAAPKMPSNLCGKEKLRVSGTVIRCFFASATCSHAATHLRLRNPNLLEGVQRSAHESSSGVAAASYIRTELTPF